MGHQIYLPVVPRIGLTSEARANAISEELFNLTHPRHLQPPGHVSAYLLSRVENYSNPGEWAIVADTDLTINVHPERDLTALIALFPQLTNDERSTLAYYIASNEQVAFASLIPSDAVTLDEAQATDAGWFAPQAP